jgi:hypothetical protein
MSFGTPHKQIHNINSDGCRPPENWEKNIGPSQPERSRTFDTKGDCHHPRGSYTSWRWGMGWSQDRHLYCMYHERDTYHIIRDCPIFLKSNKKWPKSKTNRQILPKSNKLTIYLTDTNNHSHHPYITLCTNTPTPAQNTNLTTTDTLRHITNHTTTTSLQAKVTPLNPPSHTLRHHYR